MRASRRHIAFLVDTLEVGGIQAQLLEVVRAHAARGGACTVACFRRERAAMAGDFRAAGASVALLGKRDGADPVFLFRLARFLRAAAPDLVHAMTPRAGSWAAAAMAGTATPLIGSVLNVHEFESPARCRIESLTTARRACAIVVNSHAASMAYRRSVRFAPPVRTIHNGVHPAPAIDREAMRRRLALPAGAFAVAAVGRLVPVKSHRTLLAALRDVRRSASLDVRLVIAGDGPLRAELESMASRLGIDGAVAFLGERHDVPAILAACDAFAMPSLSEGLPNALLEAMAAGLPCVASRAGGIPEVVSDGIDGVLAAPADSAEFADAIARFAADPQHATRLAAQARETAARFGMPAMIERTLGLYDDIMGDGDYPVAYIMSQFPKTSETFILRELNEMRRRGIPIVPVSLKLPEIAVPHRDAADAAVASVEPARPGIRLLRECAAEIAAQPAAALSSLRELAALHRGQPAEMAKALAAWPLCLSVARQLRRRRVRLVHAQWASIPAACGMAIARLCGARFSFTGHAFDLYHRPASLRAKIRRAEFVATCTARNRAFLRRHAAPQDRAKVHLVRHWIAAPPAAPDRIRHRGPWRILSVGSLVPYKGFDILLRAAALLSASWEFALHIVGHGPEEPMLRRLAARLGIGRRVAFLGALPQERVLAEYAESDVFALATVPGRGPEDNLPNVLVEAAYSGVPFAVSDVGSVREFVTDGETGLLVPPGKPRELARAIERLFRDRPLAESLARNSRRRADALFGTEANAGRLERLFRTTLQESRP